MINIPEIGFCANSSDYFKMEKETITDAIGGIKQIVIDFGDICRFCLTETDNNISIHDKCFSDDAIENDEATILDFVKKITSIRVSLIDSQPLNYSNYDLQVSLTLSFQKLTY